MSSPDSSSSSSSGGETAAIAIAMVVILVKIVIAIAVCQKCKEIAEKKRIQNGSLVKIASPDFRALTMDNFLNDMEREKPIRFTSQQLRIATDNFTNLLGQGGFGAVYKGIFSNGTLVAVKVLYGSSDKRIKEQFMAEVSTIGRTHHFNLVRLYGFCFEEHLRALVYEYMGNGSLDKYLFSTNTVALGFEKLHEIAVGTARGIAYLHEECQQRIVHYDIKPENILLDANFFPKVADFGLAKLCNRENTHITMTGGRGTPGYAAPEVWLRFPITHKCDVYSFGMLLFEIIGRRRNLDVNSQDSQDWFPRWVWKKFEPGELGELMVVCGIEEKDKERAERMVKLALWCVQYMPEARPLMSVVVKMLEGAVEIPTPSTNPFQHLMSDTPYPTGPVYDTSNPTDSTASDFCSVPSQTVTGHSVVSGTPIMKKYEIEIVSA
ncbi:hypothetical protein ACFX1T_013023 [Malus domestica]